MQAITLKARKTGLPPHAAIAPLYPASDLADAYVVALPNAQAASMDMESLAKALFGSQPGWAQKLMVLRDAIVARFGIKTAAQLTNGGGGRVGIFRIYAVTANEIIVGEDDSHLDFRLSMLRSPHGGAHGSLTLASAVHCHNWLGRAYIMVIRPFHKLIVRYTLSRAACSGFNQVRLE